MAAVFKGNDYLPLKFASVSFYCQVSDTGSVGSFGQAVSEEKNLKNQPIRNKNRLWWPCLLMDHDGMSNIYRGPSIDASY
jgi:hypothetical protein